MFTNESNCLFDLYEFCLFSFWSKNPPRRTEFWLITINQNKFRPIRGTSFNYGYWIFYSISNVHEIRSLLAYSHLSFFDFCNRFELKFLSTADKNYNHGKIPLFACAFWLCVVLVKTRHSVCKHNLCIKKFI